MPPQGQGRSIACYQCSQTKKKCIFLEPANTICEACQERGLECTLPRKRTSAPSTSSVKSVQRVRTVAKPIGPASAQWKLSLQQMTYSLTHHLLTVHMRHRPKHIFGGILAYQWDRVGGLANSVNGKLDELGPASQALIALGLADGASLSTHSAIVGSFNSPVPQFGLFSSVDDNLVTLGRRRHDALDHLNAQAMECFDVALGSQGELDRALQMQLLWIGTFLVVQTPAARIWRQELVTRCVKELVLLLENQSLGETERHTMLEQSYFCLMQDSVQVSLYGKGSSVTEREYIAAVPNIITSPSTPLHRITSSDLDLIFTRNPDDAGLKSLKDFLALFFLPWRRRIVKTFFLFAFARTTLDVADLITIMWNWVDEINGLIDGLLHAITTDPRFCEVENTRGTKDWESWECLHTILKHFVLAEIMYSSPIIGCHTLIVENYSILGDAKQRFLAESQKRLYAALGRFDFILGLRDSVLNYDEPGPLGVRTQLIVTAPLNGPVADVSLTSFPNLLQSFQFMAFSSVESGDFLEQYGRPRRVLWPSIFADGTLLSDLQPKTLDAPFSKPSVSGLVDNIVSHLLTRPSHSDEKKARIASEMVRATLGVISADDAELGSDTPLSTASAPEVASKLVKHALDVLALR